MEGSQHDKSRYERLQERMHRDVYDRMLDRVLRLLGMRRKLLVELQGGGLLRAVLGLQRLRQRMCEHMHWWL